MALAGNIFTRSTRYSDTLPIILLPSPYFCNKKKVVFLLSFSLRQPSVPQTSGPGITRHLSAFFTTFFITFFHGKPGYSKIIGPGRGPLSAGGAFPESADGKTRKIASLKGEIHPPKSENEERRIVRHGKLRLRRGPRYPPERHFPEWRMNMQKM